MLRQRPVAAPLGRIGGFGTGPAAGVPGPASTAHHCGSARLSSGPLGPGAPRLDAPLVADREVEPAGSESPPDGLSADDPSFGESSKRPPRQTDDPPRADTIERAPSNGSVELPPAKSSSEPSSYGTDSTAVRSGRPLSAEVFRSETRKLLPAATLKL